MIWPWGGDKEFGGGDSSEGRSWLLNTFYGNSDKPSVSESTQSAPPQAENERSGWFFGL